MNIPNLLTLLRFLLVPVVGVALYGHLWLLALCAFMLAGASDWLDGYLARRWQQQTDLGALLDPLADKAMMLAASAGLWWLALLPWWLAAAIIVRDVVIVAGGLAYHWHVGQVAIAPTRLGKLNTALEFVLLTTVLMQQALTLALPLLPAYLILLFSILLSGGHYVWLWAGKARQHAGNRAS